MTPAQTRRVGIAMLFVGIVISLSRCDTSQAHSWYEPYCCSDKDCKPLLPEEVTEDTDQYIVIIGGKIAYEIPKDSNIIRPSQDGNFHICISPYSTTPRCFYVPLSS